MGLQPDPPLPKVDDPFARIDNKQGDLERQGAADKVKQLVAVWNKDEGYKQMTEMTKSGHIVEASMASEGLKGSGVSNTEDMAQDYGTTPKSNLYPTPKQVADGFLAENIEIPCFLLPPGNQKHVPPHIVALWLMSQ